MICPTFSITPKEFIIDTENSQYILHFHFKTIDEELEKHLFEGKPIDINGTMKVVVEGFNKKVRNLQFIIKSYEFTGSTLIFYTDIKADKEFINALNNSKKVYLEGNLTINRKQKNEEN